MVRLEERGPQCIGVAVEFGLMTPEDAQKLEQFLETKGIQSPTEE